MTADREYFCKLLISNILSSYGKVESRKLTGHFITKSAMKIGRGNPAETPQKPKSLD
jgi:hypothetical protein